MKIKHPFNWLALVTLCLFFLSACGKDNSNNPSKTEAQFLSHIDQAQFYQDQGQLKDSILESRNAIQLKPNNIKPYQIIVENLLIAGDARMAEKNLLQILDMVNKKKIKTTDESLSSINLSLASAYFNQRNIEDSQKTLNALSLNTPSNKIKATLLSADIALYKKQLDEALKKYKEANILAKNKSAKAVVGQSKVNYQLNQKQLASELIVTALKVFPNNQDVWLWKAQVESLEHRYANSEESYIKALEDIGQYDIMTYMKYKTISELIYVLRQEEKSDEAFVYEQILAKSGPGQVKSSLLSAKAKIREGKLREAQDDLKFILTQSPNHPESLHLLAITDFKMGKFDEAEKLLTLLVKTDESNYNAKKLLAGIKLKQNHPKEAKDLLTKLEDKSKNPELIALLGLTSMSMGDTGAGIKYFDEALALTPKNIALRTRFITNLIAKNKITLAIKQIKEGLKHSPNNSNLKALYANALSKSNDLPKAAKLTKNWIAKNPNDAHLRDTYGAILDQLGSIHQAKQQYLKSSKLAPKSIYPRIALGKLYLKENNGKSSEQQFRKVLAIDTENLDALKGLFRAIKQSKNQEAAIQAIEKESKTHPDAINVKLLLAEYYAKAADFSKAIEYAKLVKGTKIDPKKMTRLYETIYLTSAAVKARGKNFDDAIKILDEGVKKHPTSLNIALMRARLFFANNQQDRSKKEVNRLKLDFSDSPLPFQAEGDIRLNQKKYEEAAQSYALARIKKDSVKLALKQSQALKLAKKDNNAPLVEYLDKTPESPTVLLALATSYQQQQQNKIDAIKTYKKLLSFRPSQVIALNNLAWLYLEKNDPLAEPAAKKAYDLRPNVAAIVDTYGWVLYKTGKVKGSVAVLEKANKLAPKNKEIAQHLAEIYEKTGNAKQADKIRQKFN